MSPSVYTHFLHKFEAQHEVTIFFNLRHITAPHVADDERYSISRIGVPNTFRIVTRQGYMDYIFTEDFGAVLAAQLRAFLDIEIASAPPAQTARARRELDALENAYKKQVVYIFGKEQLHPSRPKRRADAVDGPIHARAWAAVGAWTQRQLLSTFIWMRENTRSKPAEFGVQVDRLVEVGFVKEV